MSDATVAEVGLPMGNRPARVAATAGGLRAFGRRLGRNRLATLGGLFALAMLLLGLTAPWIAPYDPIAQDTARRLEDPSRAHLLGTDQFGRDLLSRLLFGSRTTLIISTSAVALALAVGGVLGLLA